MINSFRSLAIVAIIFCMAVSIALARDDGINRFIHEIKGGVLVHDMDEVWSGFDRESGVDINAETIFTPSLEILGGEIRPALGASINTSGDTSKIYFDARWEYGAENGLFFAIGAGGTVHDGERHLVSNDKKALGSRFLFHIPIEVGYHIDAHHGISIYFDHVSNAYTQNENEGLDTLGLRYGYRF